MLQKMICCEMLRDVGVLSHGCLCRLVIDIHEENYGFISVNKEEELEEAGYKKMC